MTAPPVTSRITPVIQPASSDARNRAACATSSGVPRRLIGWASINCCCIGSEIHWWFFSVRIVSGARAFTRIPNGPTWVAKCCVRIWMPAFAAAYGTGDRGCGLRATAFLLDFRVHGVQSFRIPTVDRDECALPREETGDCGSDAAGATGHPSDLVVQPFHDDAPVESKRARAATTRPHTSSITMIAWMTISGTVLGPMPIAIVKRPTNVPINAKPWTVNAIPRTVRGRIQVARKPPSRTDAITLSAAAAPPCANPGRKTPKWNAAADRNVADATSRNVRIDSADGISAADGPRCAVDVAITEPPESDCNGPPRGASFRASGRKCRSRGARLPRPAGPW